MAERRRSIRHALVLARLIGSLTAILVVSGLLAAALVRLAPGFGTDERMLNPQLSTSSLQALTHARAEQSNIAAYYVRYVRGLFQGDLGVSLSFGRPVKELLGERAAVSVRSAGAGLGLAWFTALAAVILLEMLRRRWLDRAASSSVGALLCVPAALVAVGCFYFGGAPALAIAAIVFPRIYRYLRNVTRKASAAPYVLAAQAFGERGWRVLGLHVFVPILPELLALAGISVSMAIGATIPVEALCDSPGVGQLAWQAALARDLPVIVNVTLLITALTAAANLAADAGRAAREARI
jgi:peptide/nickel transport system permease protein